MQRSLALPTGTVTFLFTDIEGSTKLLQALGAAYPDVLSQHHRLLRGAVERAGGVPIGTEGDSLFAAFDSPVAAVSAAVAAQRAMAGASWPGGTPVRVRMGLHTGEGLVRDGTYVGLDVHRAARIAAVGHGGQILMSDSTRALAEHGLPSGVQLRDLGRHRLKDLAQPERIYETVIEGLASQFPALRSLEAAPNNLPTQLTSFVGRGREVAEAKRLLGTTRLLTLTGPGGTGKTRLSLQLAAESISDFADGVFFVPLGPIEDPDLVAPAILVALGLRESPNEPPVIKLVEYLRDRHLLLIMDNFEQVLPAAALVGDLLKAIPGLTVVVTSRATLHLYGEREFAVPPLTLPHAGDDLDPASISQYEAVALFIQRAAAVRPDFQVTTANAAAVAEICSRLDGLPLAIELAAARVKLLPPQALLARLGQRLEALEAGSRDLPPRQRTLRGAIAWSHDLLDDAARRLFARFAIFVDGASLTAAEAVCSDAGLDVLSGLAGLVDQSLIRQEEADGEPRFTMLSTIREFALERLAEKGEADVLAERHAAFFVAMAEASAPGLTGPNQKRLLDELARENGNLRATINWSIESESVETALRLGFALWRFWQMRGMLREGAAVLERILAVPDPDGHPLERARALEAAGGVAYWRAEMATAMSYYEACLQLCRKIGDRRAIANALYNLGFPTLINREDLARSRAAFEESLAMYRDLGDHEMIARVLWGLGNAYYFGDENEAARDTLLEDVEMLRRMSDPFSLAWAFHTLGLAYDKLGETVARSGPLWREALEHFAAVGDISGMTILLGDFGILAAAEGEILRAVRLSSAADRLAHTGGTQLGSVSEQTTAIHPDTSALDPAEVEAAVTEGARMTVDEAVAYALRREEHL
ncbi:MAG: adenylate/guanylate cyclase domain-containing protein [Candidatus Limnocylindrales bacterium]|jgi:predicted ATPase/class 3 adenylate cyclase